MNPDAADAARQAARDAGKQVGQWLEEDRKSTRLNSVTGETRMPSSA